MTPQRKILATMKAGQKEDGSIVVNVFCGQSEEYIDANRDYAELCYADVWRRFLSAWLQRKEEIPCPPAEWARFE